MASQGISFGFSWALSVFSFLGFFWGLRHMGLRGFRVEGLGVLRFQGVQDLSFEDSRVNLHGV